jgi:hypothetical protein
MLLLQLQVGANLTSRIASSHLWIVCLEGGIEERNLQFVYLFRLNIYCFSEPCNGNAVFFLGGRNQIFKYYLGESWPLKALVPLEKSAQLPYWNSWEGKLKMTPGWTLTAFLRRVTFYCQKLTCTLSVFKRDSETRMLFLVALSACYHRQLLRRMCDACSLIILM